MSDTKQVFDTTPRKASDALKSTVEIPATLEAGQAEFLHRVNTDFANEQYDIAQRQIDEAFDTSHDRLQSAAEIAHGVGREHSGFDADSLTPKVTEGDSHGRYHERSK